MKRTKKHLSTITCLKIYFVLIISGLMLCSCSLSSVKFNTLPQPPPTAKLRIYVVSVTSGTPTAGFWKVAPEKYAANMTRQTTRMLKNRGVYEVIPVADIKTVLGDQEFANWEWMADDWSLARQAGAALHADYVLCLERSWKNTLLQEMKMFNLHTGRQFAVSNYLPKHLLGNEQAAHEIILVNYRTLFREAQGDLLQTALNKRREVLPERKPPDSGKKVNTIEEPAKEPPQVLARKEMTKEPREIGTKMRPAVKQITAEEKQLAFEKEMEAALTARERKKSGAHIVVYDFDSTENLRIIGLILTESLREELHKLGGFTMVNRENMAQLMEELKLQQSGLVNEKQAIKLGQWMAANEAVTGNFAVIGKSSILQAKRIDIKTLGTLSLGSLRCKTGDEDELLNSMADLARKLTQLKNH